MRSAAAPVPAARIDPRGARIGAALATGESQGEVGYPQVGAGRATPLVIRGEGVVASSRAVSLDTSPGTVVDQPRETSDPKRIRADQITMAAIAAGDGKVFARVAGELSPVILRFARSVLDSTDEADEVVQEALVRLWQSAGGWQPTGQISTWLYRVTFRLCIDVLRRRRPAVAIDELADVLPDGAPLPSARMARLDDVRAIRAAIAALPARQRAAIVLCHFQGLNQAEGAAVMGVGEHAYESLLARARRNLRATLSNGRATP